MVGVQYDAAPDSIRRAVRKLGGNDIAKHTTRSIIPGSTGEFNYLAQTEKEIRTIETLARAKNYKVNLASGIHANEESVKSLSLAARENGKPDVVNTPAILHIATHGYFFPDRPSGISSTGSGGMRVFRNSGNPLIRSGLALAGANNAWAGKPVEGVEDGILTAYEVSNMYLPNTQLAVLSACETGLGNVQGSGGVYGLQRAFRMAAVENLVMKRRNSCRNFIGTCLQNKPSTSHLILRNNS